MIKLSSILFNPKHLLCSLLLAVVVPAHAVKFQAESPNNFYDTTNNNVDTEPTTDTGGGRNVGWIEKGEWLVYNNLNIPTTGNYTVRLRVASPTGATASVDLNGGSIVLGNFAIPNTGGYQKWTTVSKTVRINAGNYRLGVFAQTRGWNFNWIEVVGASTGGGGGGATGFAAIVSEAQFKQMFPNRNGFYTYSGLVAAAKSFPSFATTGDTATKKREAAAALANFSHETGGLVYVTEIAKGEYCGDWDFNPSTCPCEPGKRYYGRGPIQLSWNGNYCAAGDALGLDLRRYPEQVEQNATTAWKTALWFWMTQQGAGYWPAHTTMTKGYGFGETIRTINGALECDGRNPAQVQSRINEYNRFLNILGTSAGPGNIGC